MTRTDRYGSFLINSSGKDTAKDKGVHREAESEGSRRFLHERYG